MRYKLLEVVNEFTYLRSITSNLDKQSDRRFGETITTMTKHSKNLGKTKDLT